MTRVAEPRQRRSRQRRAQLLEAALALLAEGGVRAVTHRAVARRAGLPAAATTYYFSSIHELVREALELNLEQRLTELRAVLETAVAQEPDPRRAVDRFAHTLLASQPRRAVTQLELYLQATRDPELRSSVRESLAAFEDLAAETLGRGGLGAPSAARTLVAVVDGVVLHELATREPDEEGRAAAAERLAEALWAVLGPLLAARGPTEAPPVSPPARPARVLPLGPPLGGPG
ncbi:TetR/AcrR family transcriptional regulator [Aciditerrimonas ferrireducens]|uniref:TetR/AcrR family transcriptional regulator n=1 Tax=Aciditerrimonas ferrireducens TaxID=667306 RepID=A0ABV6C3D2_9ACTN